jgi:hypothetical protein
MCNAVFVEVPKSFKQFAHDVFDGALLFVIEEDELDKSGALDVVHDDVKVLLVLKQAVGLSHKRVLEVFQQKVL